VLSTNRVVLRHKKEEEEYLAKNPNFTMEDFSHGTFVAYVFLIFIF